MQKSNIYFSENISVINNGVENKYFKKEKKYANNEKNNKFIFWITVISVCRFVEQKNVKDIIQIAKKNS